MPIAASETPDLLNKAFMRSAGACHSLMCSRRRARRTTPARALRRSCRDQPVSYSGHCGSSPACVAASRLAGRRRLTDAVASASASSPATSSSPSSGAVASPLATGPASG
eukprot:5831796-Alexandrium_andersonii.AAC.1